MATATKGKGSSSDSGKGSSRNPKSAASSVANKNTNISPSSLGSSKAGAKSTTAKTGGSNKGSAAKSSSASKTGASKTSASKTSATAKKAGTKGGTAKASTAGARGGSKTSTGTKSGAAGKRTASGGAKQSAGRSNSGGSTKSKSANGAAKSPASRSDGKGKTAKASSPKSKQANTAATGKAGSAGSRSATKKGGNGVLASAVDAIGSLFAAARPNAIDLLKADHEVVNQYFNEIKAQEDANHRETYKKIKFELDAHAHIEETIFYPYLIDKGDKELNKIVLEGIEEHRQVKLFLAELGELHGDNERFKAKLKVLMEDVEHHVGEEEDEMFPMVEDQVPREVLETLGTQMEKEKTRFQKMMAPKTEEAKRASTRG